MRISHKAYCVLLIATLSVAGCNTNPVKPLPDDKKIGVILMHGKGGTPNSMYRAASVMRSAGAIVLTPEMPWSRNRIYAKGYDDSMQEIDAAVLQLKKEGAETLFVGGQSMGSNAALGYAAKWHQFDGLILFAPGHVPGKPFFAAKVADSVEKARKMVANGRGDERASFGDFNQGSHSSVQTTANIYLSWFDPQGPSVMSTNAAGVSPSTPVFCVDGSRERFPQCSYVRSHLAAGVSMESITVNSGHRDVPDNAGTEAVEWMRKRVLN